MLGAHGNDSQDRNRDRFADPVTRRNECDAGAESRGYKG